MPVAKTPGAEVAPGYRLVEPLVRGPYTEVWACAAPDGRALAAKLVPGSGAGRREPGGDNPLRCLERLARVRHPFLLALEHVRLEDGELVLVAERADRSLRQLFEEYRAAGRAGVPRAELLAYLREAAEALDVLNREHGVAHLDVKPDNLYLVNRHVKVGDAGLVQALTELQGGEQNSMTLEADVLTYAAPESFRGEVSPSSDQYSLAVTYVELLTGHPPFAGTTFRQLALQHLQDEPDLQKLPFCDRAAVARALAKDPRQRFDSCADFIQALLSEGSIVPAPAAAVAPPEREPEALAEAWLEELSEPPPPDPDARSGGVLAPSTGAHVDAGNALDGYAFLECVGRTSVSEVWKARTPDGGRRIIKLFFGFDVTEGQDGASPVDRLRSLRHEGLVPAEVISSGSHRVAVVAEEPVETLASRHEACRARGLPGIPRAELLGHLRVAAGVLDDLRRTYRLQHLGLSPQHVVLDGGRVRLADFGAIELLCVPAGQPPALHPRYAARELFRGQISPRCDQYSLALLYQEMLTGCHPFRHLSPRQMAAGQLRNRPDLGMLPSADRAAVQRALHSDPDKRFAGCVEFVATLEEPASHRAAPAPSRLVAAGARPAPAPRVFRPAPPRPAAVVAAPPRRSIGELIGMILPGVEIREFRGARYVLRPGRSIEHHCFARLLPSTAWLKLDGFRQQWQAELVSRGNDGIVYHVKLASTFWQRCLGRSEGLEVRVRFPHAELATDTLAEVAVAIRPFGMAADRDTRLLHEVGPQLLESLRHFLQAYPERRGQERLAIEQTVQVYPALAGPEAALVSQARDISVRGMGLLLPCQPPAPQLCITLPAEPGQTPAPLAAQVVRARPCGGGRFDVGVRFLLQ